jgi:predicted nucleic acid-binding protein
MKTTSTLEEVPAGCRIFLDAGVFIYHFHRASAQCRVLLERCERGEVRGVTSVIAVLEATHRLMMAEAVRAGHVTPGGVARKLRERPEVVRSLTEYRRQVESIPHWGVQVLPVDLGRCFRAADERAAHGLFTNDSIIAATMRDAGVTAIATADRDFERVDGIQVYRPTDLGAAAPALA